jgi:ATP-binding cassette subfamily C protein
MMGSFGPVTALASLSNNLNQTLASGERVLSLLEEEPQVQEVGGKAATGFTKAAAEHVDFTYETEKILKDYSVEIPRGKIIGIHGASGSGKSTLLKLLMRFWDVQGGKISISDRDVRDINTADLREMESYVTQETCLFHDSIANNIAVGKPGASREEIIEAAKKASIHEFIMTLPQGYDTEVGELGDTLSGGEKQRIGIARAFLHDAPFVLMDEPTSNLDSLNEGIILKSLKEGRGDKTVLLVSHRKSTMNVADVVYEMDNGRIS